MKVKRWAMTIGVVAACLLVAGEAEAQRRGGSFGGRSGFGRSSRSGSSRGSTRRGSSTFGGSRRSTRSRRSSPVFGGSSRRRSSGSGSYSSSPSSSRRSGGSSLFGGGALCCFLIVAGGFVAFVLISRRRSGGSSNLPGGGVGYMGADAMHVSRLSVGVDWRARRELQEQLMRLAQGGDTSSPQGLAHLLRETVLGLRRSELAWLYVAQENQPPALPQNAEAAFDRLATQMRAAFQHEVVRSADGQVHAQAGAPMRAHPTEGEGTVVVHLIIASRRPLRAMQSPDANELRAALDDRAGLGPDQLVALEVVWSPADEDDRMSTAELEQFYPDMLLIDPTSIAGRIFCSYCRGPFAMELLNCPHCGAPAEQSQNNRSPIQGA